MEMRSGVWKASFVAAKIVAIYLVVHAVIIVAANVQFIVSSGQGSLRWSIVIASIVVAALGAELWLAADSVADRIEAATEEDPAEGEEAPEPTSRLSIDTSEALPIGIILLGFVVLADALPSLGIAIANIVQTLPNSSGPFSQSRAPLYFFLFAVLLRIALGSAMIFAARQIATMLTRARRPSRPEEEEPANGEPLGG